MKSIIQNVCTSHIAWCCTWGGWGARKSDCFFSVVAFGNLCLQTGWKHFSKTNIWVKFEICSRKSMFVNRRSQKWDFSGFYQRYLKYQFFLKFLPIKIKRNDRKMKIFKKKSATFHDRKYRFHGHTSSVQPGLLNS